MCAMKTSPKAPQFGKTACPRTMSESIKILCTYAARTHRYMTSYPTHITGIDKHKAVITNQNKVLEQTNCLR